MGRRYGLTCLEDIVMNVLLNRIDERMIHGQILAAWVRKYSVELLVVLDDALAGDPFTKSVFTMAMPKGVSAVFMPVREGVCWMREHLGDPQRAIVLFCKLSGFDDAFQLGYAPRELNIGSMIAGPNRKKLTRDVYATKEEVRIMKRLISAGTAIYIQVVGAEARIDVAELLREQG